MNKIIKFNLFIILLFCSCGCSRKMQNYYPPEIYSIDTIISELYPEAITWQTDAFLSEVHFDLKEDTILNTATFFYSPTNEYESLNIYLYEDGTIKKNIITHKLQIKLTKQLDVYYKMDSKEALNIFYDSNVVQNNLQKFQPSEIYLRFWEFDCDVPIWGLTLDNVPLSDVMYFVIDPITLEVFERTDYLSEDRFFCN